jgi:hypothetical protein
MVPQNPRVGNRSLLHIAMLAASNDLSATCRSESGSSHLRSTSLVFISRDFVATSSPTAWAVASVATRIVHAILNDKSRVVVGPEARLTWWVSRQSPESLVKLLGWSFGKVRARLG